MKADNQKTISVRLKPEIKEKLLHLSKIKDRSPHWIMNKAITTYVEQENKNEQLRQETLERWKEVEQGQVVDHEKVSKWLDSWGTDSEEDIKI
jgi:predicted transcriptional regulator